ncbi:MAG: TolC family outer membrane protein [Pseudomonadota bacterium]
MRWLSLCTAVLLSTSAHAGQTDDLLRRLVDDSPLLDASRLQADAAKADLTAARGAYLPQLSVEAQASQVQETFRINGLPDFPTVTREPAQAAAVVNQALFTSGRIGGAVGAAKAQAAEAKHLFDGTRQDLLLAGAATIADLVRDRAILSERRANESVVRQRLEESVARRKAGLATLTDVQQSEARLAGATADRVFAEGAVERSEATFVRLFGFSADADLMIPTAPNAMPTDLQQALDVALARNPDVAASDERAVAARQLMRSERGALLPQVSLNATAGYLENERFGIELGEAEQVTVSLQGRWAIFSGGSGYARTRAANRRASAAQRSADQARRDIREQTISAWTAVNAGRSTVRARRAQAQAADIAARGVAAEFTNGRRTRLDVLDADREKTDADVALIAARRDLAVAEFSLLRAMGSL